MGPNLACDKILNHREGSLETTLFPVTSGTVTFDFRDRGINRSGVYPILTTTSAFTPAFMNRLAFTSNFPLQGSFRQSPVTSGGTSYHQLEFVVTSFESPYAAWMGPYGLDLAGDGAPGRDPDHDGLNNLMEYVLGSSPLSGIPENMPIMKMEGPSMTFSFQTRSSIVGTFESTIEYSTDMITWTTATPSMIEVYQISGRGIITRATIPRPADGKVLFARLRVAR